MKFQKNSLKVKIWFYLILFSVLILSFLWLFQIAFLDKYYEWYKTNTINEVSNKIEKKFTDENYENLLNSLSYEQDICIEVIKDNVPIYKSGEFNKGCFIGKEVDATNYKQEFINSNKTKTTYKIINPRFDNKTLVSAIKMDDDTYIFVNASLIPLDKTALILKNQLIFVVIGVFLLASLIAYFISRKISNPIIKLNSSASKMAKGEFDVVFETNEDIAEINELTDTLNHTRDELAKTEELRRELMANVSHDLKTPLTMIKAYAEKIKDLTYKDETKREHDLNVIIEETDRLNLLVNDILDLSKIQSQTSILNYEKFNINKLISDILKRFDILVEKDNYKFIFENKTKIIVEADKKRIEQVIYNLINNAINYVGKDKTVIINTVKIKNKIRVEVIDHGNGIDNDILPLIWDKYYKIDKQHKRNSKGTGLGLSIVKNILEKHNYEYGVISNKGSGTTFYFEIDIK